LIKTFQIFEFTMRILNLNHNTCIYDYMQNDTYLDKTKDFQVKDLDQYGDHALSKSENTYKQIGTITHPVGSKTNRISRIIMKQKRLLIRRSDPEHGSKR